MDVYQIYLPAYTAWYMLQVFVFPSLVVWRRSGVNPFVFGSTDNAHDYVGRSFRLLGVATWISVLLYSFFPDAYQYILPVWYMESHWFKGTGVVVQITSLIWITTAQVQMSNSWRIGIDYGSKTKLVENGLFRISRNPVFLGIILSYIGMFLISPNGVSAVLLTLTLFALNVQVRLEEEHLSKMHGEEYERYRQRVRRWI